MTTKKQKIAVLDAGGQYVDLVHKAVLRQGFPTEVLALSTSAKTLEASYAAVVISGSPASSHAEAAPMPDPLLWQSSLPVFGICYGMQAMVVAGGGTVAKNAIREDGRVKTNVDITHPLFQGVKSELTGLFTHGDFVVKVPKDFKAIGQHVLSDGTAVFSAIARGNHVGVQFHPEVFDDTPDGYQIFENFLKIVAGLKSNTAFKTQHLQALIAHKRKAIKKRVGDKQVIAFVSGGVDSTVATTLAAGVVAPDKMHAYYIDNGFMRDEDEAVIDLLNNVNIHVQKVEAAAEFLQAKAMIDGKVFGPLIGVSDPQTKRRIIGKAFIDVQNRIVKELELKADEVVLLQGTNAADRIESGYSKGDTNTEVIKWHHNLVPEARKLNPIEPLDDLFKDEVRAVGAELGLPYDVVQRQPCPGPALAIRILCLKTDEYIEHTQALQEKIQTFVSAQPASGKTLTSQLLPIRNVGVGGDERSHLSAVALQGKLAWSKLAELAVSLPAHFRQDLNRVVYALGDKPLQNLTPTPTDLSDEVRVQLRHADRIVFEEMTQRGLLHKITQFPVVLLPLSFAKAGDRSIVLRPILTNTFMTVRAMIPGKDLPVDFVTSCTKRILHEVPGISQVFLDLTNKPPATTEWE